MAARSSAAIVPESRQTSLAKFAVVNAPRFDELRKLLWIHLPHGSTREISEVLGCQEAHVSRQLSGERRLTEEVATYALHLIKQQDGVKEVVNRIRELRDVVDLEARIRIALTLYPDGRCEWEHLR
ncbi:MAG: hypothetical protein M3547_01100 [Acidobacteriota bacterium]|nr:hypothetical protein [Acidobacteriota bacterium]